MIMCVTSLDIHCFKARYQSIGTEYASSEVRSLKHIEFLGPHFHPDDPLLQAAYTAGVGVAAVD